MLVIVTIVFLLLPNRDMVMWMPILLIPTTSMTPKEPLPPVPYAPFGKKEEQSSKEEIVIITQSDGKEMNRKGILHHQLDQSILYIHFHAIIPKWHRRNGCTS